MADAEREKKMGGASKVRASRPNPEGFGNAQSVKHLYVCAAREGSNLLSLLAEQEDQDKLAQKMQDM